MDLESFGYVVQPGADQQKEAANDPGNEPEVDTGDERDPEVEEILFEADQVDDGPIETVAEDELDQIPVVPEEEIEIVGEYKEAGRPSKLDDDTIKKLNTGLKVGLSQKKAAIYAGIGESTYYRWQRRYNEIDEACKGDPDNIGNAEDLELWEFWQSIKKAKVEGEIGHLGVITKAAENGVWQASAWFMERTNPEEWGKRERNKLEDGKEDEEIHVVIRYSS